MTARMKFISYILLFAVAAAVFAALPAQAAKKEKAEEPLIEDEVVADSRIRVFVYDENEVYKIFTQYGYQSNIEFGKNEKIVTMSLGETSSFRVTPAGNRLFIKAMRNDQVTNLTVITNYHSYQFEISSAIVDENDVIYVARFYYPDEEASAPIKSAKKNFPEPISMVPPTPIPAPMPAPVIMAPEPEARVFSPAPSMPAPSPKEQIFAPEPVAITPQPAIPQQPTQTFDNTPIPAAKNLNYSMTGSRNFEPEQVFDDGKATYMKFSGSTPSVYGVAPDGKEFPLMTQIDNGYVVVDAVLPKLSLRMGSEVICLFNDGYNNARVSGF